MQLILKVLNQKMGKLALPVLTHTQLNSFILKIHHVSSTQPIHIATFNHG